MTSQTDLALRADRTALLELCAGLDEADWKADSGCPGWSVKDVVAHLGALYQVVVDPSALPDVAGLSTEDAQAVHVLSRRAWTPEETVADYAEVSSAALERLAGLAAHDFEVPLGDLGTYPANVLPSAFCFDHYTHIRADLFAPRGPLTGTPPPSDELRLAPALDWIEAALPQQNPALDNLSGSVEIVLTGPAARTITLGHGEPQSRVASTTDAFIRWVTQRATWTDLGVASSGDQRDLAILTSLHVF
jgi:uncharacterized protein (TIGR03083 family)